MLKFYTNCLVRLFNVPFWGRGGGDKKVWILYGSKTFKSHEFLKRWRPVKHTATTLRRELDTWSINSLKPTKSPEIFQINPLTWILIIQYRSHPATQRQCTIHNSQLYFSIKETTGEDKTAVATPCDAQSSHFSSMEFSRLVPYPPFSATSPPQTPASGPGPKPPARSIFAVLRSRLQPSRYFSTVSSGKPCRELNFQWTPRFSVRGPQKIDVVSIDFATLWRWLSRLELALSLVPALWKYVDFTPVDCSQIGGVI